MSQPQKGICAEPNLHAQYLQYNVIDEDEQAIRSKLARVIEIFDHFDDEHYEAMVKKLASIDLTKVIEEDDNTDLKGELACAGGQCDVT